MKIKKGFTLIEILVVISITAILGAVGLASYGRLNQQKTLETETKKIKDVIQLAKQRAISPVNVNDDGSSICSGTTPYLGGYEMRMQTTGYSLNLYCVDNVATQGNRSASIVQISSYLLDPSIVIQNPATITFKALSLGSTAATFKLYSSKLSKTNCISVSATGVVTELSC